MEENRRKCCFGWSIVLLSELREAFKRVLDLKDENIIFPENAQLYIAIGAGLLSVDEDNIQLKSLIEKLDSIKNIEDGEVNLLEPLFKDKNEYEEFSRRHEKKK